MSGSDVDKLYDAFCVERDAFIKQHFPKKPPRVYLHNPLWHLYDAEEDRKEIDERLARFAADWWQDRGMTIDLNRDDGSFTVRCRDGSNGPSQ